jgi:signal transduction histidine kinase
MLDMARLQSGRFTVDRTEENIIGLAKKVITQSGVVAEERSTKLVFKKPAQPVKALVDSAKIAEAMANFVENAIKYSPKKSRVEVDLRVEDDMIIFEVLDEGMGVPVDEREHLFGKFYRAVNARTEEPDGNGIGLYVVRSIARKHGGDAYYEPRHQGSMFGFWIPLKRSTGSS